MKSWKIIGSCSFVLLQIIEQVLIIAGLSNKLNINVKCPCFGDCYLTSWMVISLLGLGYSLCFYLIETKHYKNEIKNMLIRAIPFIIVYQCLALATGILIDFVYLESFDICIDDFSFQVGDIVLEICILGLMFFSAFNIINWLELKISRLKKAGNES